MSNPNEKNPFDEPAEGRGFTSVERVLFSLFVLITLALIAGIAVYFIRPTGKTGTDETGTDIALKEIPLLPPAVVENISNGDIFITLWHNGKFEKFSELKEPRFDNTRNTVVIIHGLFESSTDDWLSVMAKRIYQIEPQINILAVDWSKHSLKEMSFSWESVTTDVIDAYKLLAKKEEWLKWENWIDWDKYGQYLGKKPTKQMIEVIKVVTVIPTVADDAVKELFADGGLQIKPEQIHIIGFSHGAHIGGLIGKKSDGMLQRLTVLDPSTRLVHFENLNPFGTGWDSKSAKFTDMYQTSFWAGTGKAYGHRTFKVLEKGTENGWLPPLTPAEDAKRHNYAPKWFVSTIGSSNMEFGYSIIIPDNAPFQDGTWTGTIISTLPRGGDLQDVDKPSENKLVP
jgi:hypothetical protein